MPDALFTLATCRAKFCALWEAAWGHPFPDHDSSGTLTTAVPVVVGAEEVSVGRVTLPRRGAEGTGGSAARAALPPTPGRLAQAGLAVMGDDWDDGLDVDREGGAPTATAGHGQADTEVRSEFIYIIYI